MSYPLPLQSLPAATIRWLAAGEVIDSLAAAVRELIENALDAEATRITIEVWPAQGGLRVSDNGHGIPAAALPAVALPYTTSKVVDAHLPLIVRYLGFRGQALHALAHLGSLTIATCVAGSLHGWEAHYDDQGTWVSQRPLAMAPGTVVRVANLWHQWPQRQQHRVDRKTLDRIIQQAALTHPHVTWMLMINDQVAMTLSPGVSPLDLLPQWLPRLQASDCRQGTSAGWHVVLALPDRYHRPRPDWCQVALNRRMVKCPELLGVMTECFQRTLPARRYPLCLAFGQLPPESIDWHRHPAKTEVYLQDVEQQQEHLKALILDLLAPPAVVAPSQFWTRLREAPPPYQVPQLGQSSLPPLTILGQIDQTYILTTDGTGLWLIEQHVAHERVRYEDITRRCALVPLAEPLIVGSLSPRQQHHLGEWHYQPELFGDDLWCVRAIPEILVDLTPSDQITLIHEISACEDLEQALVNLACRTAIRNGTPLPWPQMQQLIERWQQTRDPHTCPHGRPVYLCLRAQDLARFFRRRYSLCHPTISSAALGDLLVQEIRHEHP